MNQFGRFASIAMAAATLCISTISCAAESDSVRDYPNRPITLLVPFGPGTTDLVARFLSKKISEATGKPVVVENKPGADGVIGIQDALRRPADGYTIIIGSNTPFASNVSLFRNLPYDPVQDLVPISGLLVGGMVLAVAPDFPARNVTEFVALLKKNPGKYTFGSGNSTSLGAAESLRLFADVDIRYVNYKSIPAALTDLIGGQIDMVFGDMPPTMPLVNSGKLRVLGVTTKSRVPGYENIPTIAEQGFPGYEFSGWVAAFARKGTPPEIIQKLSEIIVPAMRSPEAADLFGKLGWYEMTGTGAELSAVQNATILQWKKLVESARIEPK